MIVSGRGHENIQDFGKRKILFSDKKIMLNSIKIKNKLLSNNFKINILKEQREAKNIPNQTKLNKASINSRDVRKNDIFFAIRGKKNDGNDFIDASKKKGHQLLYLTN